MRPFHPLTFTRRLLLAILATPALVGCSKSSDEEQIHAVLEAAEVAAEARNTSAVLDLVATDYSDVQGLNKAQLRDYLRAYFLTHPTIKLIVHTGPIELETANRARVRLEVMMLGTQRAAEANSEALTSESEALQVELQRRESAWLVMRVDRLRK